VTAPRSSFGKGNTLSQTPLKANYQPSGIFGAIKPVTKEALSKHVTNLTQDRLTSKTKGQKPKAEKPKGPLTEDEKQVFTAREFIQ